MDSRIKRALAGVCMLMLSACDGDSGGAVDYGPTVNFTSATAAVAEGGTTTLTVSLSAASPGTVTLPFTLSGTATGGTDSVAPASPVTLPPGATTATITIVTTDDAAAEPDETIVVTLGTPGNAQRGSVSVATVTIDDDGAVTPPPPPTGGGVISGRVTDAGTGVGLSGVTVASSGVSTLTVLDGTYTLGGVTPAASLLVNFTAPGRVPQSRTTDAFTASSSSVIVNVPLLAVAFSDTYSPTAARTIAVPGSVAQVQMAANSLRRGDGSMPGALVTARLTPIAPAGNLGLMPGNYRAAVTGGTAPIESFGALDVSFVDADGAPLNLATGATAILRIPLSSRAVTPPASVPLFFFNTTTGLWMQEGTATLQGSGSSRYYEGTVSHFTTWNADQIYDTTQISGCVEDAGGVRVAGATVTTEGKNYTGSASAVTNASGEFVVAAKRSSEIFLQAVKGDRISNSPTIGVLAAASQSVSPCLSLTQATVSIKLTWGDLPGDLDSHTMGANSDEHIYFGDQGGLTASPFIALDVDDVDGFGPEVTTLAKIAKDRTYSFFVDNYSRTFNPGQTGSPAQVELIVNGVQRIFTPPLGETSSTEYWRVFNLVTDASCNITVVPVQQFVSMEPENLNTDNSAVYCD